MSRRTWAKMPSQWIQNDGLWEFASYRSRGILCLNVSALKLYFAIVTLAGTPGRTPGGEVSLSYTKLGDAADVSRAMIRPGLDKLGDLIGVVPGSGRSQSTYRIPNFSRLGVKGGEVFAKLPVRPISEALLTGAFNARSRAALEALLLYLTLLRLRFDQTNTAVAPYGKLSNVSGLDRSGISRAITVLSQTDLITLRQTERETEQGLMAACNQYEIRGLSPRRRDKSGVLMSLTRPQSDGVPF